AVGKARALGDRLHEPGLVSYALNALGLAMAARGRDGTGTIEQALRIALDARLQEAAGRAYSSLQEAAARLHKFEDAERYYAAGMATARTATSACSACACWAGEPAPCC